MTSPTELIAMLREYSTAARKTAAYRMYYQDQDGKQEAQSWANVMMLAAQYLEGAGEEVDRAGERMAQAKLERDSYGWAIRKAPHDDAADCGGFEPRDLTHCVCWKLEALS